jgi:hypothetical protein
MADFVEVIGKYLSYYFDIEQWREARQVVIDGGVGLNLLIVR